MIGLTPERIAEELQGYSARITEGLQTLRRVGEIEAGVSPRDPVYREDKLTLYRYRPRVAEPSGVPLLIVYALVNRVSLSGLPITLILSPVFNSRG